MKLYEKHLKWIIKVIERYAVVHEVKIESSSIIICPPLTGKVIEVDLNKANKFNITFTLGTEKEKLPVKGDEDSTN